MTPRSAPSPDPWQRLRVDPGSGVPIWVQLKTQLEYIIATNAVAPETRLPAVRAMAQRLGIAIDTVRQAYDVLDKAGLVVTRHGAGTFTALPATTNRDGTFDRALGKVDAALFDLAQQNADGPALISALGQRVQLVRGGMSAVFIGVAASARRYAEIITSRLPNGLGPVRPITLEELRQTPAELPGPVTHAICLVFHLREVADLLAGQPTRVLSVVSELEPQVLDEIEAISAGTRPVLVARPETRPIYEELIRDRRPDLVDLPFVRDDDEEAIREQNLAGTALLHTSAAANLIERAAHPATRRVELRHAPTRASMAHIDSVLRADWELALQMQRDLAANPD